eukprot:comp9945_c0_seq1/m.4843 comp9945_c0_seq1/g.4843  ORF comp9945_c0_seq1/g.4843 comp9945_c0_seq1/m.4843 type:complete len:257 (-) comp9945_c0_seq1:167-937(-)
MDNPRLVARAEELDGLGREIDGVVRMLVDVTTEIQALQTSIGHARIKELRQEKESLLVLYKHLALTRTSMIRASVRGQEEESAAAHTSTISSPASPNLHPTRLQSSSSSQAQLQQTAEHTDTSEEEIYTSSWPTHRIQCSPIPEKCSCETHPLALYKIEDRLWPEYVDIVGLISSVVLGLLLTILYDLGTSIPHTAQYTTAVMLAFFCFPAKPEWKWACMRLLARKMDMAMGMGSPRASPIPRLPPSAMQRMTLTC